VKTKPFYLVIEGTTAKRVTQRWPTLYPGEFAKRLAVTIPDEVLPLGTIYQLELDADPTGLVVTAESIALPEDGDDEVADVA